MRDLLRRWGAYLFAPSAWETETTRRLEAILGELRALRGQEKTIMKTVADIQAQADAQLAAIQSETSVVNAVKAVVDNQNTHISDLASQVKELQDKLAAGSLNDADLQKLSDTLDAIKAADTSNAAVVSAAVVAGTPAAPSGSGDTGQQTGSGDTGQQTG